MQHIKSLDGIRFLAVSLVLAEHWLDGVLPFGAGYLGVCMFFVLSGFLITNILLKAKLQDDAQNKNHGQSLKMFYIRRTIRIFPIYYILIFLAFALGEPSVRQFFWWCVSYTSNFFIASHQTWMGSADHLWSLAVEEQFYIFFPFVVFFINIKNLPKVFLLFIVVSVLLRCFFYAKGFAWMTSYVLMPTCLDAFGMGALMAYFYKFKKERFDSIFTNNTYLIISVLAYVLINIVIRNFEVEKGLISIVFLRIFESLLSVFIIGNAIVGRCFLNPFLEKNWVVYIGKISYGVYIFHNFIFNPFHSSESHLMVRFFKQFPVFNDFAFLKFIFLYAITVLLATISWFMIEKPINKLKDKFVY
jgi:peptidoglycan/LPS O-acetylase OafA/YrhL